jgi:RHS repeat-associated protein
MTAIPTCASRYTGKERDTESGLDYFGARYYASIMGRFMSPDWAAQAQAVPYARLDNPQTLNLYSYVGNNPLSQVDEDGHFASPWHFFITFFAATVTGHNPITAFKLGVQNAMVDLGTQSGSPADVRIHAMAVQGQSPSEAYVAALGEVSTDEATGNRPKESHTIDDSFAWGHNYSEWTSEGYKGLGFWGTLKHEIGDWLPTPWTLGRAIAAEVRSFQDPNADPTTLLNHPPGGAGTGTGTPTPTPPPVDRFPTPQCIGCFPPPHFAWDDKPQ